MKELVVDDGDRIGELSTSNKSIPVDGNLSKDVLKEGSIGTPCLFLISGCWNGQYKRALVQLQPTIVIKSADCAALLGPSRPRTQVHLQTSCTENLLLRDDSQVDVSTYAYSYFQGCRCRCVHVQFQISRGHQFNMLNELFGGLCTCRLTKTIKQGAVDRSVDSSWSGRSLTEDCDAVR